MDCTVTLTLIGGQQVVLNVDDVLSPKKNCMNDQEYVTRIAELGLITQVVAPDLTVTTRKISQHCICEVEYFNGCELSP